MHWNTALRLHSFAQYFCIITLGFVLAGPAHANPTKDECSVWSSERSLARRSPEERRFCEVLLRGTNADNNNNKNGGTNGNNESSSYECDNAKRTAEYARTELNRKCGDAGLSKGACFAQMKKCASAGGEEEYRDQEDLLVAFSNAIGVPQGQVGEKCPDMSGQDFFDEKEKVEKNLDDINDDLADVKKEIADLNKDFSEKVKDVQEEIADAQKELKEKQLEIKKDQRERAMDFAKTSAELSKAIRDKQSLILRKRQDINNIYRSKNTSLISMSENVARRTCRAQARKLQKEYENNASGGSIRKLLSQGFLKKKDVQNEYEVCKAQFDQQRISLIEQTEQKIEQIQDEINNAQSDIDNMTQQLSSMNSQEAEAKNDDNTAINNETTALTEKISRATAELQSLQQTTQQEAEALTQKQSYYQQKATRASNSLMQMESSAQPKKKSTASIAQVQAAYSEYVEAVLQIPDESCHFNGKADILKQAGEITGSKYSSPTKKGSK